MQGYKNQTSKQRKKQTCDIKTGVSIELVTVNFYIISNLSVKSGASSYTVLKSCPSNHCTKFRGIHANADTAIRVGGENRGATVRGKLDRELAGSF